MKIEAVTVCIDFSDKLSQVIENNKKLNRWIIVTHDSDESTIELCKKHGIEYICSKRVFDGAPFAKGRAINDGLSKLAKEDWLLHLDADQLLPDDFKTVVQSECTDKSKLYGCARSDKSGTPIDHGQVVSRITATSRGRPRVQRKKIILPIGYFQLWHSSVHKNYEEKSITGDKDDMTFMHRWFGKKHDLFSNTKMLGMTTTDVSEFQGHFRGHFVGIRNIK